jgi:IS30 family transposase
MAETYVHFTRDSRIELAVLLRTGLAPGKCAKELSFDKSSVSREVSKYADMDGVYRAIHADKKAKVKRMQGKQPQIKLAHCGWLKTCVIRRLKKRWSPEQIAGRLKHDHGRALICHETIYSFVYGERTDLARHLRRRKSKYRRKRGTKIRAMQRKVQNIRSIDERSKKANNRSRLGDWEGDTMVGKEKTQRILTHVERKAGYGMADKLNVVTAELVYETRKKRFKKLPKKARKTLTDDNGPEFGEYDKDIEASTGMLVYRAHPYHSWERGSNENWNGLLRDFFPKGMMFAKITQSDIEKAVRLLNDRPRKRLGWRTPREVFRKLLKK